MYTYFYILKCTRVGTFSMASTSFTLAKTSPLIRSLVFIRYYKNFYYSNNSIVSLKVTNASAFERSLSSKIPFCNIKETNILTLRTTTTQATLLLFYDNTSNNRIS